LGYRLDWRFKDSTSPNALQQYRSIAVLSFLNMTGDQQMDYLGDGTAEELINTLSRRQGLKVSSRTSSFAFKGRQADARQICEKLGVDALIEGSVRIAGGLVRVTAQLIDGDDGTHVWSKNFDHDFADLFALQGDITNGIMRSLEKFLHPA
jgi:adenylate cyclase